MSCQGKTKKGEQCKVRAKDGKEVCWRHDPEHTVKKKGSRKTKKQLNSQIKDLEEKIKYLDALIIGMKMMIIK